jgi:hypothetical protein
MQSALQFYLSVGFVRINNNESNGWDKLPQSLHKPTRESPSCFIKHDPSHGTPPCKLMHLWPGHLQVLCKSNLRPGHLQVLCKSKSNVREIIIDDKDSTGRAATTKKNISDSIQPSIARFFWCRYPVKTNNAYAYINTHVKSAIADLPLIQNLLPPPYNELLQPSSFRFSGEMMSDRCIDHNNLKRYHMDDEFRNEHDRQCK